MERPISNAVLKQVQQALFDGRKIEAIKLYRTDTGVGLREAKQAVEKLEAEWRVTSPEKFTAAKSGKGCVSSAILILAALGVLLLFLLLGHRPGKVVLKRESGEAAAGVQK